MNLSIPFELGGNRESFWGKLAARVNQYHWGFRSLNGELYLAFRAFRYPADGLFGSFKLSVAYGAGGSQDATPDVQGGGATTFRAPRPVVSVKRKAIRRGVLLCRQAFERTDGDPV